MERIGESIIEVASDGRISVVVVSSAVDVGKEVCFILSSSSSSGW